jgi:hypothetical protein
VLGLGVGSMELPPCLVPQSAAASSTVNLTVDVLWDEHRVLVHINTRPREPVSKLPRLGEEVVFDHPAFIPGEGREVTEAVLEVERYPRPGTLPHTGASPIAPGAWAAHRRAVGASPRQLCTMRERCAGHWIRIQVRTVENAAQAILSIAGENGALVGAWIFTCMGPFLRGPLP